MKFWQWLRNELIGRPSPLEEYCEYDCPHHAGCEWLRKGLGPYHCPQTRHMIETIKAVEKTIKTLEKKNDRP